MPDEIIVQVDAAGKLVGPIEKKVAHNKLNPITHAVVMVILSTDESDFNDRTWILQVRAPTESKYPNDLTLAATGHMSFEPNTSIVEMAHHSAHRELAEETKGFIDPEFIVGVALRLIARGLFKADGEEQYLFVFIGELNQPPQIMQGQNDEVSGMQLLRLGQIMKLIADRKVTPFAEEALKLAGVIRGAC